MVGIFDRIRILLSRKPNAVNKTEPLVSQPAVFEGSPLATNYTYSIEALSALARSEIVPQPAGPQPEIDGINALLPPPPQKEEEINEQPLEVKHDSELERLKHYAELAKQNKIDSDALNEDLE